MKIIIVGGGKVGLTLTEYLAGEGHDLVVIDTNPKVTEHAVEEYDVMAITGNGATYAVQMEAGVGKANLLIAVTHSDELNIICCLVAKKIGVRHTIARVRNMEYGRQIGFMKEELGLSMLVNPESETATEISRILRFPSASQLESFDKGRVELASFRLDGKNPLVGKRLAALRQEYNSRVLVCAVQRGDGVVIPSGDFDFQAGDILHITGNRTDLASFFKVLGVYRQRIKSAMLIGGGKIAYYLAVQLLEMGIYVKIIEQNEPRCALLSELLPKADIACGDGTDPAVLLEEGIEHTDAIVALTDIDEENVLISLYSIQKSVKKVVAKINRSSYGDMLNTLGLESIVSPKNITANRILRYVRARQNSPSSSILTLYKLVGGAVEALEFQVTDKDDFLGVTLTKLKLKSNVLIACIIRANKLIYPCGDDTIEVGDNVVVITTASNHLRVLRDILQ